MKFKDYFKESHEELNKLKSLVAQVAQKEYEKWTPEEDGGEEEWGGGGICHTIAESIVGALSDMGIDAISMQASVGENHTFVIAKMKDGIYNIDVPPNVYEIGSGYQWAKKPGVAISSSDVIIDLITKDLSKWEEYNDEMNEAEFDFGDSAQNDSSNIASMDVNPKYVAPKKRAKVLTKRDWDEARGFIEPNGKVNRIGDMGHESFAMDIGVNGKKFRDVKEMCLATGLVRWSPETGSFSVYRVMTPEQIKVIKSILKAYGFKHLFIEYWESNGHAGMVEFEEGDPSLFDAKINGIQHKVGSIK